MTDLSALDLAVTVQLTIESTSWWAVYELNVSTHDASHFKAKAN